MCSCEDEPLFLAGWLPVLCSQAAHLNESFPSRWNHSSIERSRFHDVLVSPESYKGRVLVLGGEVLNAKRLRDGTQIELLQLPLEDGERPSHDRQQSQGRFLAMQQEFLDPATMTQGTRVTIVGEVSGSKTDHLDDVEYRYPTLIVKHLHVWRVQPYGQRQPGFSIGGFGGMGIGGGSRGGGGLSIGF